MKRSFSTAAMAISGVLFGGRSADAFVSRGGVISSSCCSPKIKNPNRRTITIQSDDHMPWPQAVSYSSLSVCSMRNDKSSVCDVCNEKSSLCDMCNDESPPHDFSRREMMDITLGAMTGWILGPRVTFAAPSSSQDDIGEMLRKSSED